MKKNKTSMLEAESKSTLLFFLLFLLVSVCAKAEILKSITIDDLKYSLDTSTHKATVTGKAQQAKSPYHLVIPESVTYEEESYVVTEIGRSSDLSTGLFYNNYITGITLPNTLEVIGPYALTGCSRLSGDLVIPNSVRRIEVYAFSKCSTTANLILGNSLEFIGNGAFESCKFTGNLIIPESVTYIGNAAFALCQGFTGSLRIPDSVTTIGFNAFKLMPGLSGELYIGKSVHSIGSSCFYSSISLFNSIEIYGDNLTLGTSDGANTIFWSNSYAVKRLYLSEQVKKIYSRAFYSMNSLEEVISDNPVPPSFIRNTGVGEVTGFSSKITSNAVLKVPVGSVEAYKKALYWKDFLNIQEIEHEVTEVSLNETEKVLFSGDTFTLHATIIPESAKDKSVIWKSSDEAVATVDANGKVTAVAVGKATITATAVSGVSASCAITVIATPVSSIIIDKDAIGISGDKLEMRVGESKKISVRVEPETATDKTLTWHSSNETVAIVDNYGLVTAQNAGDCQIIVKTADGSDLSATCDVVVYAPEILVSSITLNPSTAAGTENEQIQVTATVFPEDATNKVIRWSSSDESIASVNDTGLISLLKKGTAVITASATDDSGVYAECEVVISELSSIKDIIDDESVCVKIFNLKGVLVYEGMYSDAKLLPDYYIVVRDGKNIKVKIK